MFILDGFAIGLSVLSDPMLLLLLALGSLVGTLVGALPGLGPVSGCALLLPVAFAMPSPEFGMGFLCSIYLGCMFGARITAILLNVPGDAVAVVTAFDGYPMMQQGRGGIALGISAFSSFFGGFVSFILLAAVAQPLAIMALHFGPPEYAAVLLFGFAAVAGFADDQYIRSLQMIVLGIFISMVGMDLITATPRYVYLIETFNGIEFAIIALGIFGISEVMIGSESVPKKIALGDAKMSLSLRSLVPSLAELKQCLPGIFRGTAIGTGFGFLPGAGATIASFITYSTEKSVAKDPSRFGKGAIEGIAAPEAANNASVGGSMIPTLALGVPGTSTAAILLGAMVMFGVQTGPRVFETSGPIVWSIIVGFFISNIMLLFCNTMMIPFFVWIVNAGQRHLKPIICAAAMIGTFAIAFGITKLYLCIIFGILGYAIRKLNYPSGPFLLGLVLFPKFEVTFRQALVMSKGDYTIFFRGPLTITFISLSIFAFTYPLIKRRALAKKSASAG